MSQLVGASDDQRPRDDAQLRQCFSYFSAQMLRLPGLAFIKPPRLENLAASHVTYINLRAIAFNVIGSIAVFKPKLSMKAKVHELPT